MTEDDETRSLVRRAGDELPVSPAPVDDLLQQGRQARRRRTLTTVGVVVAAVAVITSGAVAVGAQLSNEATANPPVATPTMTPPSITVPGITTPPGTRLVGRNGIGIAVPTSWGTNRSFCEGKPVITQIVDRPNASLCWAAVPGARSVVSLTALTPGVYDADSGTPIRLRGGVTVMRVAPKEFTACAGWGPCPGFHGALLSTSQHVLISVTSTSRPVVKRILDSVFAIPRGYTALPPPAGQFDLPELGFDVQSTSRVDRSVPPRTTLGLEPPAGSVVPEGSTVTVIYSRLGKQEDPCPLLRVSVNTPGAQVPIRSANIPYRVDMKVGESITLDTRGGCGPYVGFRRSSTEVLQGDLQRLTAIRPGKTSVGIKFPVCGAGVDSSTCRTPRYWVGRLRVHVSS